MLFSNKVQVYQQKLFKHSLIRKSDYTLQNTQQSHSVNSSIIKLKCHTNTWQDPHHVSHMVILLYNLSKFSQVKESILYDYCDCIIHLTTILDLLVIGLVRNLSVVSHDAAQLCCIYIITFRRYIFIYYHHMTR